MKALALLSHLATGEVISAKTLDLLLLDKDYHPGDAPVEPEPPGRKAGAIERWRYRREKEKWRNHHMGQSPWWDWLRAYYKSEYWKKEVRPKVFARDGFQCTYRSHGKRCRETGSSDNPLQAHHKHYRWVGKELRPGGLSCLQTLCKDHHDMIEKQKKESRAPAKPASLIWRILFGS